VRQADGGRYTAADHYPRRSPVALRSGFEPPGPRSFTGFLPLGLARSPRGHRGWNEDLAMADFLVVAAIVVFVAAMLGLIWALARI
jgi:hypothetical protein